MSWRAAGSAPNLPPGGSGPVSASPGTDPAGRGPRSGSRGPRGRPSTLRRLDVPVCREQCIHHALDGVRLDTQIGKSGSAHEPQLAHHPAALQPVAPPAHEIGDGALGARERRLEAPARVAAGAGARCVGVAQGVLERSGRGPGSDEGGEKTAGADPSGNGRCHDRFPPNGASAADCLPYTSMAGNVGFHTQTDNA